MAGDDEQRISGDATIGLCLGIFLMMSITKLKPVHFLPKTACAPSINQRK